MRGPITILCVALLVTAGSWLYASRLGDVPAYLLSDEATGAVQAHAIATTGRDLSGRLLPLYFTQPEFPPGRDPLVIYLTALVLKVAPFSEAGVRATVVLIAVVNVALMFLVAQRLFQSTAMGVVAALLLLLTPVHFMRGRLLLSPITTIPFILAWLWALWRFTVQPTSARLAAAALVLGFSTYSYLAAVVMMPIYLLITLAIGFRRLGMRPVVQAGAAFIITLLPMVAWYLTHPERNAEIVSAYQLDGSPVARWIRLYWAFFDPAFLFISGDSSLTNSTREAGYFPMAFAVLIPIGLYSLVRSMQPVSLAIAGGLVTAPLVTVISGALEMNRVMFGLPFGVLAAAYGAHWLLQNTRRVGKAAAIILLASVPWQFVAFHSGYMGPYRLASAQWFAGSAREGVRALMRNATGTTGPLYISSEIEWVSYTWRFYAIADAREHMIGRVEYTSTPPPAAPPGALLLLRSGSAHARAARQAGWDEVEVVSSIDGARLFDVLRRATTKR
jgi:4-amino-4-deoxy-L-arabinose transferase-like glycosyltransferase